MRVIIAGCRYIKEAFPVYTAIEASQEEFSITEVVSGGAAGVDMLGERWALRQGIPTTVFQANWNAHGKAAGPIRNKQMAEYADALIAVWDGESPGTKNMIETMEKLGKPVLIYLY